MAAAGRSADDMLDDLADGALADPSEDGEHVASRPFAALLQRQSRQGTLCMEDGPMSMAMETTQKSARSKHPAMNLTANHPRVVATRSATFCVVVSGQPPTAGHAIPTP